MEAGKIAPWFGCQSSKPGQKVQRLEEHLGSTVPIGRFQFIPYPSITRKR